MTKAKKQLSDLIENRPQDVALPSKNAVRRAVHKINCEMNIITKIIDSLKGVYAMTENNEETNTVIYTLDKELEDIGYSVDVIIEGAEKHLEERINAGESYLKDLFRETNQEHDHDLRNSDLNLLPPKPKSNLLKKSFSYSGAVIWNSLPRHVRLANSLTEFKMSLKFSV
jgi:hypothetical protein